MKPGTSAIDAGLHEEMINLNVKAEAQLLLIRSMLKLAYLYA